LVDEEIDFVMVDFPQFDKTAPIVNFDEAVNEGQFG
jgi:hypothetical protein